MVIPAFSRTVRRSLAGFPGQRRPRRASPGVTAAAAGVRALRFSLAALLLAPLLVSADTPLPSNAVSVGIGPDGRVWSQTEVEAGAEFPDGLERDLISRVFDDPAPVLPGIATVLFEPNGAVWFCGPRASLLRYDGADWVEREIPGRGAASDLLRRSSAVHINGTSFFLLRQQVLVFDGREWHEPVFDAVLEAGGQSEMHLDRHPEADDLLLTAKQSAQGDAPALLVAWVWQRGTWSRLPIPPRRFRSVVALDPERILLDSNEHGAPACIARVSGPEGQVSVDLLLGRLRDSDEAEERAQAMAELEELGLGLLSRVHRELAATADTGYMESLLTLGESLCREQRRVELGEWLVEVVLDARVCPRTGLVVYDVSGCRPLGQELSEDEAETQKGALYRLPDGTWSFHSVADNPHLSVPLHISLPAALGGTAVWTGARVSGRVRSCCDLVTGEELWTGPQSVSGTQEAIAEDGTLFEWGGPLSRHVHAYSSSGDATTELPELRVESTVLRGRFITDGEGCLWGWTPERVLVRFDGEGWRSFPQCVADLSAPLIAAGSGSAVVHLSSERVSLVTGTADFCAAPTLRQLVAERPEAIQSLFRRQAPVSWYRRMVEQGQGHHQPVVAADAGGGVWVFENRLLARYIDGEWEEYTTIPGGPEEPGAVFALIPVRNGQSMIAGWLPSGGVPGRPGGTFWQTDTSGAAVGRFHQLPLQPLEIHHTLFIATDANGDVWIPQVQRSVTDGRQAGRSVCVGAAGPVPGSEVDGWPVLMTDAGGWFGFDDGGAGTLAMRVPADGVRPQLPLRASCGGNMAVDLGNGFVGLRSAGAGLDVAEVTAEGVEVRYTLPPTTLKEVAGEGATVVAGSRLGFVVVSQGMDLQLGRDIHVVHTPR